MNTADENSATGAGALLSNSTGRGNTANGAFALNSNTTGEFNTAVGYGALVQNTTGNGNVALGYFAGSVVTTASSVIAIGNSGANENNTCWISNIFGVTSAGGTAVFVNANGKLGTTTSSRRFKDEIKPMDQASEALFALVPVTFRYKKELDPQGIPQWGLVAEDVEKVNPDLVVPDGEGKVNTVRYDAVNAMLLNEFLKARREIDAQQKQIDALTAGRQKVAQARRSESVPRSAFEVSKFAIGRIRRGGPAPQTVLNEQ